MVGDCMNKIDLIIDALDRVINACKLYTRQDIQDGGTVYLEEELEASIKALAAARELRELKPVAWITKGGEGELWWYQSVDENGDNNPKDVALYALDGEQA